MLEGSGATQAAMFIGYSDIGFEQALQHALAQADAEQAANTTLHWDVTHQVVTQKQSPATVTYVVYARPTVADMNGW